MRQTTSAFRAFLDGDVYPFALLWKFVLRDGTVKGLTDFHEAIVHDGITYRSGAQRTAIRQSFDASIDNVDISTFIDDGLISAADVKDGKLSGARVDVYLVNWSDLAIGKLIVMTGLVGEVSADSADARLEVRGLTQKLAQKVGSVFQNTCRARLFDGRCKLSKAAHTEIGTVKASGSRSTFTVDTGFSIVRAGVTDSAGYNTTVNAPAANQINVTKVTVASPATAERVYFYANASNTSRKLKAVIYSVGSDGKPDALLAASAEQVGHDGGWNRVDLPEPLALAAGDYYVGLIADGNVASIGKSGVGTNWYATAAYSGDVPSSFPAATASTYGKLFYIWSKVTTGSPDLSKETGHYDRGLVTWTSGANAGQKIECRRWDAETGTITLLLPLPRAISVGDEFEIVPGCDGTRDTCIRFQNILNFRGEPDCVGEVAKED